MKIEKKSNGTKFADAMRTAMEKQKSIFREAVSDAKTQMVARTASGKDIDNRTFAKYSESYAEKRRKAGRKTSPPDLIFTGEMLSAIRVSFENAGKEGGLLHGIFSFVDPKNGLKALGNMKKRNFFGLTEKEKGNIRKRIEQ